MTRSPARLVSRMSLREDSASSVGRMPMRPSSGSVSSRMRPFARASVTVSAAMNSGYASDAGAQLAQALLDVLVAAVQVVDAIDDRLALGHEPGDDEARRGAQVGGHHGRAGKPVHAVDHGRVSLSLDARAQAAQLLHVHEPILEDGFGHQRGSLGDGV